MEFYKKGGTFVEGETSTDKKTILIVDDEQPIIDMLVYNLEKEGYNTLELSLIHISRDFVGIWGRS